MPVIARRDTTGRWLLIAAAQHGLGPLALRDPATTGPARAHQLAADRSAVKMSTHV
ncbi:hypothetical protein [Nocardia ignorata]|uniref:hypothetical protein n=1 Tax=Nocardia ignorata TaxID=145285 RepID=UPI000AA2B312|nr:hypothetical protein [Nocardia ignorata]